MKNNGESIINTISKVKRDKLGKEIPIEIFRVFRHFSQIYAEDLLGKQASNILFLNAGKELGKTIGRNVYDKNLDNYLENLKKFVENKKIGILNLVENSNDKLVFQLDECITCSGMDNIEKRICFFEVGLVAGAIEEFLGHKVFAKETKCNANGEDVCEITVYLNTVEL